MQVKKMNFLVLSKTLLFSCLEPNSPTPLQLSQIMASVSAKPKLISFADIVHGREANVRVTDDGLIYAVDLVMVMTGLSRDDSGKTIRRLPDEIFPSDRLSEIKNANSKISISQQK